MAKETRKMMTKIKLDGKRYELLTLAYEKSDYGGVTIVDENGTRDILRQIREMIRDAADAADYAAEQREYEAGYESDKDLRRDMYANAERWSELSDSLKELLMEGQR